MKTINNKEYHSVIEFINDMMMKFEIGLGDVICLKKTAIVKNAMDILDLKTKDVPIVLTALHCLTMGESEEVLNGFCIENNLDEKCGGFVTFDPASTLSQYKKQVMASFLYNPGFFTVLNNTAGLIAMKAKAGKYLKNKKQSRIKIVIDKPPEEMSVAEYFKYYIVVLRLKVSFASPEGPRFVDITPPEGEHIGEAPGRKAGTLKILANHTDEANQMVLQFKFDEYSEEVPNFLIIFVKGMEHPIRLNKIVNPDPEEGERFIITSDPVNFDFTKGLEYAVEGYQTKNKEFEK